MSRSQRRTPRPPASLQRSLDSERNRDWIAARIGLAYHGPTTSAPPAIDERYQGIRNATEELAAPLSAEDQTVQSMPDVSPTKWHRAHVTWFFETFLLEAHARLRAVPTRARVPLQLATTRRSAPGTPGPQRGSSPARASTRSAATARHVDAAMRRAARRRRARRAAARPRRARHPPRAAAPGAAADGHQARALAEPARPRLRRRRDAAVPLAGAAAVGWRRIAEAVSSRIGARRAGLRLRQRDARATASSSTLRARRPAWCTNGEWLAFIDDGGYQRPELWLSDGWAAVRPRAGPRRSTGRHDGTGTEFTLAGREPLDPAEPVCHVSYYEADAFARWAGARLPTEAEWEAPSARRAAPTSRTAARRTTARGGGRRSATSGSGPPRLPRLSRLPAPGRGRRVQRQVHGQPARAARRVVRHAPRPRPADLPELLPAVRPLGLLGLRLARGRD